VREIAARRSEDDPISWIDRHADQIRHLRALEAELAARDRHGERQRIAAVQIDPPDHITAVLGPLPESYLTRPAWERAVAAIETYRPPPPHRPPTTTEALSARRRAASRPTSTSRPSNAPSLKPDPNSTSTRTSRTDGHWPTGSSTPQNASTTEASASRSNGHPQQRNMDFGGIGAPRRLTR
jgi:hypothetical protein